MRRTSEVDPGGAASASLRSWRATTAIRVFALALATGTVLGTGANVDAGPPLAALMLIGGVASVLEWGALARRAAWTPVAEALLVTVLLTSAPEQPALLSYLAVPPIVGGVRHGLVTTVNATLVSAVAVLATLAVAPTMDVARLASVAPWLAVGLGVGGLASWQSRSMRDLVSRQAPYAAAHQLMAQLHDLARRGDVGFDGTRLAGELEAQLRALTGADRAAVFVAGPDGRSDVLASHGDTTGFAEQLHGDRVCEPDVLILPLRGDERVVGHVLLGRPDGWPSALGDAAQSVADEFALRLDTAVLFDDVRLLATAEERNRIAREMHDGVAQEIVALGYVVDEIESVSAEPETQRLASGLRDEITRVVTELRFSIFDLRHHISDHHLSGALAEYVREVGRGSDIRVHLVLDESGPPMSRRVQTELLRVAQEAIGNVRRHARADNLWVTLVTDASSISLRIEDDGVGNAMPRDRHWGLQTMRERAEGIGACLSVEPRAGGGTVVCLKSRHLQVPVEGNSLHEHHSPAGR